MSSFIANIFYDIKTHTIHRIRRVLLMGCNGGMQLLVKFDEGTIAHLHLNIRKIIMHKYVNFYLFDYAQWPLTNVLLLYSDFDFKHEPFGKTWPPVDSVLGYSPSFPHRTSSVRQSRMWARVCRECGGRRGRKRVGWNWNAFRWWHILYSRALFFRVLSHELLSKKCDQSLPVGRDLDRLGEVLAESREGVSENLEVFGHSENYIKNHSAIQFSIFDQSANFLW